MVFSPVFSPVFACLFAPADTLTASLTSVSLTSMTGPVLAALLFAALWWLERSRAQGERERAAASERALAAQLAEAQSAGRQQQLALSDLAGKLGAANATADAQRQIVDRLHSELAEAKTLHGRMLEEHQALSNRVAELRTTLTAEAQKLSFLDQSKQQMADTFKLLAGEVLKQRAVDLTQQNHAELSGLLAPLHTRLQEFEATVHRVYVDEGKDRAALKSQVDSLMDLNRKMSQDAEDLTKALKGSSKTQGDWGEIILERILEASGMTKGRDYLVQESYEKENGRTGRPDVVVHLPEGRHLIIDAKVSLLHYDAHCRAEDEAARNAALTAHLASVRTHIKGLSEQNYQALYGLKSLDFVIMFVPIEPAFLLAISRDDKLWQQAWQKNILLVSPSTLLFVLRTVTHLWRQERQNQNVQEIARRGAELYNKLVGFVEDLQEVGERLTQAQKSYDDAFSKFATGKGNVIRQAELLKGLGVKPSKALPQGVVESAQQEALDLDPVEMDNPLGLNG